MSAADDSLDDGGDAQHGQDGRIEENVAGLQTQHEPDDGDQDHDDSADDAGLAGAERPSAAVRDARPIQAILAAHVLLSFPLALALLLPILFAPLFAAFPLLSLAATLTATVLLFRLVRRSGPFLDRVLIEQFVAFGLLLFDDFEFGLRLRHRQHGSTRGATNLAPCEIVLEAQRSAAGTTDRNGHGLLRCEFESMGALQCTEKRRSISISFREMLR